MLTVLCFGILPSTSATVDNEQKCVVYEKDASSCTYTNIMDSYDFHQKLLYNNNKNQSALITKIVFEDCFLDNIPKELFMAYKNLDTLDFSNANLERLEHYDSVRNNVRFFNVSNNRIYKLGGRMLRNMVNLTSLDLSHNIIDRINPSAFEEIPSFKYLNLSHNVIKKLDRNFFNQLKSLEVLKLDHNMISEISGDFSNFQTQWKELYLQHNMLISLDPAFISPSVSKLDLSLNSLTEAKLKNTKLIELLISHNELKVLNINKNLEILKLSANNMNAVTVLFDENKSLKHLDLSDCELESMKDVMFNINQLYKLEILDLSDTRIEIHENTFKRLSSLKTLKLSGSVEKISEGGIFKDLKSLVELDFSANHIVSFDLRELENSKSFERLSLRSCYMYELRSWQNVSNILPKLKKVDLYENHLICEELKDIAGEFHRLEIVIEEAEDVDDGYFLMDNCVNSTTFYPFNPTSEHHESTKKILWYLFGILVLCFVFAAVVYLNKRFDLFERAVSWASRKRSNYSSELLGEGN